MPVPESAEPVEVPLLRSAVYDTLRELIIEGTLAPGERTRDSDLAKSLGVSRTPVREALQRLAHEGLVETTANRWTRIASLDIAEAKRIYPIVWSLDELALRLGASRLGAAVRGAMASANQARAAALADDEPRRSLAADAEFHGALALAADNPDLVRILDGLRARLRRLELAYFGAGLSQSSVEEHERVLIALEQDDLEAAARAVSENWKRSLDRLLSNAELLEASNHVHVERKGVRPVGVDLPERDSE